ncbi:MAG: hypothetical protein QOI16_4397, partial [Pseudonocardiales bacterium]|nr:hypothetical protein [Pseudonocardiales bacterium]
WCNPVRAKTHDAHRVDALDVAVSKSAMGGQVGYLVPAQEDAVTVTDQRHTVVAMTPEELADLAHLRRARDRIDRDYAQPLDVPAMGRAALMSPAHFSRKFRAAYGETPYSYLMTRRIERAKALLRQGMSVTDTCFTVGCTSLGSFSSRFTEIVGVTPTQYRARDHRHNEAIPSCVSMVVTRPQRRPAPTPSRNEEASARSVLLRSSHDSHRLGNVHLRP